ncbi:porin [Methylophaga sp. OBS1]|jgi:predicted porin|uniref:porin n=1 Tax=Methylophaga sp. OBS1 TaxID=2991933 RepID=UPI002254A202|nr:porin [Methylophaga sp. OBS1]MCX4193563.1 porin [Methylophaga sp. OBS1]
MKSLKKTTLASLVGAAALATAGAANATIVVGGENGYEFSIDGNINQFFVSTDNDNADDNVNEVRNGLLPTFFGFNVSAPEVNGLKIGARVSISPSTNGTSYVSGGDQNALEQREAFATIDGSFGQILAGKALGLYGSHNILTEQTLYGVGYGTTGNGQTTLGGIGFGYDYADWRSQLRWTSPDMNGFKVAFAVVDPAGPGIADLAGAGPTGPIGSSADSEDLRYEADLSYAGAFDNGSYMLWLSGMVQDQDDLAEDKQAWTVGGTLKVSGFEFMAQYSDAEDATGATAATATASTDGGGSVVITPAAASRELEWDQYVVQAGYRFAGTTLVSANYSELEDKSPAATSDDTAERITLGVYHDVNANLKLVAEYTKVEHDDESRLDADIFALGGFVTW